MTIRPNKPDFVGTEYSIAGCYILYFLQISFVIILFQHIMLFICVIIHTSRIGSSEFISIQSFEIILVRDLPCLVLSPSPVPSVIRTIDSRSKVTVQKSAKDTDQKSANSLKFPFLKKIVFFLFITIHIYVGTSLEWEQ